MGHFQLFGSTILTTGFFSEAGFTDGSATAGVGVDFTGSGAARVEVAGLVMVLVVTCPGVFAPVIYTPDEVSRFAALVAGNLSFNF